MVLPIALSVLFTIVNLLKGNFGMFIHLRFSLNLYSCSNDLRKEAGPYQLSGFDSKVSKSKLDDIPDTFGGLFHDQNHV